MTEEQLRNIKLPALVKRTYDSSGGKQKGDIFIVTIKSKNHVYDSDNYQNGSGHWFQYVEIIKENYDEAREQLLEIEELL